MFRFYEQAFKTFNNNECKSGDIIQPFNEIVIKNGISPTITTRNEGLKTAILPVVEIKGEDGMAKYAIRKLTETECGRLMGFKDSDTHKMKSVVSKTQQYKEFGNSIVKQVLMAIFLQMGIQGKKRWNEMTVEERQNLINSSLDFI